MMPTTDTHGRKPNRLAREKSPYLLQHAYNPVDWHPWGEEAFERARREGRPIFLSIGYSTCHWCHVMERESFEDDSTAALLNASFVPVKVDREERPDVDRVYMTAAQAMGLGGGWPLNVFLTPDLKPFYGGTYFPPDARQGRPSFRQVLASVERAWSEHRAEIERTGDNVLAALAGMSVPDSTAEEHANLMEQAAEYFARAADHRHGGFGSAPKFPSVVNLDFLLRWWSRAPEKRVGALELVTAQLDAMRAGGIHDHLGGGFHRYATDREWLVPHFEKMLYDQAQLAWAYLEGFQSTGRQEYAGTARDIFAYVTRDLSSPEGGFCSAEDADSEGEEGKFYVWTQAEIAAVLPREEAALFSHVYGVTPHGNFEQGTTILSLVHAPDEAAKTFGLAEAEVDRRLARARAKLLEARARRVRPHRDDKVLAAWNGLMISAYARGARVLDDPALSARAVRAAEFVWRTLWDDERREIKRRWRDGEAAGAGQLGDYACVALGFLDLYQATHDPAWLGRAARVTEAGIARFWDEEHGGFFESPADDPSIKVRMKDGFDGAEIAGNSIAAWDLVVLGALLDRRDWQEKARRTLDYYARRLAGAPVAMPQMLVAMDASRTPPRHIVIAGEPDAPDTRALVRAYDRRFLPRDVLLLAGGPGRKALAEIAPFTAALTPQGGRATAYVCVNFACRLPVTEPEKFAAQLEEHPAVAREQR